MALSKSVRDKAIISLFGDSGLRLSELASVSLDNIDWGSRLIKVVCKGNKEGLSPFGEGTELLLRQRLLQYSPNGGNTWSIGKWEIEDMPFIVQFRNASKSLWFLKTNPQRTF
jgi:integrase